MFTALGIDSVHRRSGLIAFAGAWLRVAAPFEGCIARRLEGESDMKKHPYQIIGIVFTAVAAAELVVLLALW